MVGKTKTRVRLRKPLSEVKLTRLPAGTHFDGDGLYLNVEKSGSRSWLLRVAIRGKRHWMGLCSLSKVTLAESRVKARNLRVRADNGEDVLEQRRAEKEAERRVIPTFEEAARTVHQMKRETFAMYLSLRRGSRFACH